MTAVENVFVDGDQVVTITASTIGLPNATTEVTIIDDNTPFIALILASESLAENAGTMTGWVMHNTLPTTPLLVTLSSSDTSVATVPASVTFPVSEYALNFVINIVDDQQYSGNRNVTIRAAAAGFASVSWVLEVIEDDPQRFWHNYINPMDVNLDGNVSPIDAC